MKVVVVEHKSSKLLSILTDSKTFPGAYFPTKKSKAPHKTNYPVTGLPARYQALPFSGA